MSNATAIGNPNTKAAARATGLEGPIPGPLLSLAWPVLVVLALQTFVGLAETYFVSLLGTDALAGVALVFPLFMLMTMMSNGGIGGGVSSAVARAIGAGRRGDAEALAMHAVAMGLAFGALFAIGAWLGGPALFRRMGAQGDVLANALLYSNVLFLAAIPGWVANLLAATLRGAGNVRVPAIVTAIGAFITLALSPLFILGWGWVPRMGVAGAGIALLCFNTGSAVVLATYLRSRRSGIRLVRTRLQWRLLNDILRVGLLSAIGTVVANLTVVITTGLVGVHGRDAIAGYGLASRLDYLLIPLLFALGTASVTMVGTNMGAGQAARARKIAWTGALLSTLATSVIGLAAATFPDAWLHLFSRDPQVVAHGAAYLVRVAPFYSLFGAGMSLYFASQGAGKMLWPFAAGIVRLALVALGGTYLMHESAGSLNGLYWMAAAGYAAFGAINILGLASGLSWRQRLPFRMQAASAGR
jgi:MATE family, multidrug efflux pump